MANNFKIKNAELVEVQVPTGNTKQVIYFPDLPNIRTKQIEGIEAYSAAELTKTVSGNTVQAEADVASATLTLYYEGGEYFVVPLNAIKRFTTGTFYGDIPALNSQKIDWTKCYVTLTNNIANFAGKSFVFNVYYIR